MFRTKGAFQLGLQTLSLVVDLWRGVLYLH